MEASAAAAEAAVASEDVAATVVTVAAMVDREWTAAAALRRPDTHPIGQGYNCSRAGSYHTRRRPRNTSVLVRTQGVGRRSSAAGWHLKDIANLESAPGNSRCTVVGLLGRNSVASVVETAQVPAHRNRCNRCHSRTHRTPPLRHHRRSSHLRHRRTYSHKYHQFVAGGCALGSGCAMSTEVRNPRSRCRAGSQQTRNPVRHRRKHHQRRSCKYSCKSVPPCRSAEGRAGRRVSPFLC